MKARSEAEVAAGLGPVGPALLENPADNTILTST
jgi:hypothetical protein